MRAQALGASPALAFYILAIFNAASFVGRLSAALGDLVGRFNLAVSTNLLSGVLLLVWWAPLNSVAALIAFAAIYSPAVGIVTSLYPACVAQVGGSDEIGARVGTMYALAAPFTLAAPPISGALVDRYGSKGFGYTGIVSGIACLVGGGMMLAARQRIASRWREIV